MKVKKLLINYINLKFKKKIEKKVAEVEKEVPLTEGILFNGPPIPIQNPSNQNGMGMGYNLMGSNKKNQLTSPSSQSFVGRNPQGNLGRPPSTHVDDFERTKNKISQSSPLLPQPNFNQTDVTSAFDHMDIEPQQNLIRDSSSGSLNMMAKQPSWEPQVNIKI